MHSVIEWRSSKIEQPCSVVDRLLQFGVSFCGGVFEDRGRLKYVLGELSLKGTSVAIRRVFRLFCFRVIKMYLKRAVVIFTL